MNEYRIIHSMKLLAEKPLSINEICYESGFNNFSYFNKTFKEYTQKSPSQYRKSLKILLNKTFRSNKNSRKSIFGSLYFYEIKFEII